MGADDTGTRELIQQLRHDLYEARAEIKTDLAKLVSREVHDVQLGRVSDRVADLKTDLDRLIAAIESDRKTVSDRRASDRRMVWGSILAAALSIVVSLLSKAGAMP